jgi:hypothetical protein
MSGLEIKDVIAEIGQRIGGIDGIVVVYPHQLSDGAVVAFKHTKFDVVVATARIWLRNKVEFYSERAFIPILFGELSFGQNSTNVMTRPPAVVAPTPMTATTPTTADIDPTASLADQE